MSNFEQTVEDACTARDIPGAIVVAGDISGKFYYEKAFGYQSLKDPATPMALDNVMWLASCTKLVTTIAALQCVERGLLSLDGDICEHLPEFKGVQILTGFDEESGKPILIDNHKTITLRHLLTHSSGIAYDIFDPLLARYQNYIGKPPKMSSESGLVKDVMRFPLLFAPGDSWAYGANIDWTGQMVERVNGNISLEEYSKKNVWEPLGVESITFHPVQHPEINSKIVAMSRREGPLTPTGTTANPDGKVTYTSQVLFHPGTKDCYGGAGTFGSPLDYFKCLHSICSDDGRLLKSETIDEMFKPQLSEAAREGLMKTLSSPDIKACMCDLPQGSKVDFGLGGMINLEDIGGRSKGSLAWVGYANHFWWINRKDGICGMWASQLTPPGDPKGNLLFHTFEEEMYRKAGVSPEKL
ncbi:9651a630-2275-43db-bdea-15e8df808855 [Sclerotinia trifoliorum]|uniref:9651a630-2275-43db-bdea-15e8df808855 n=1 Tax=Sclerotinia trifoliorum TaxID=28548 RepID=A0A8H2ZMJ3_9HELO|nr:9651a630-2275-43db-bdea-15e8df808855 [Sclerotinia trifoliorum]